MIDRLGHFFWRLGRLSLDSTRESRGLKDLLQNYSYREVDCNSLAAYKNSSSVPCDSLSNLVTISLVDKVLNSAMSKMISLEALNKKLNDVKARESADHEDDADLDSIDNANIDIDEDGNILNYEDKDKLNLAITSLRIQIGDLVKTGMQSSRHVSQSHFCRCLILQFMLKPTKDHLRKAFKVLKQSEGAESDLEPDLKVGLVCCVLKYQLLNCKDHDSDYEQIMKWLNKLKIPNFTNSYVSGSALSLFEFVTLFNVWNHLTVDVLEKLQTYQNEQKALEQQQRHGIEVHDHEYHSTTSTGSDITARCFSSDGEYEEDDEAEEGDHELYREVHRKRRAQQEQLRQQQQHNQVNGTTAHVIVNDEVITA
ncbi:unnamed protein product [Ambrosiozyma monospora]|uniref:Unnamed protein product n=1 Tax=Ambrosiozyma monospora TaxID=43982 RepID=A0ACB5TR82_AMBMO|nr:unnamed protein product [Ambrosiozyma monospora]